jgi:hypothetical protein
MYLALSTMMAYCVYSVRPAYHTSACWQRSTDLASDCKSARTSTPCAPLPHVFLLSQLLSLHRCRPAGPAACKLTLPSSRLVFPNQWLQLQLLCIRGVVRGGVGSGLTSKDAALAAGRRHLPRSRLRRGPRGCGPGSSRVVRKLRSVQAILQRARRAVRAAGGASQPRGTLHKVFKRGSSPNEESWGATSAWSTSGAMYDALGATPCTHA